MQDAYHYATAWFSHTELSDIQQKDSISLLKEEINKREEKRDKREWRSIKICINYFDWRRCKKRADWEEGHHSRSRPVLVGCPF